MTQVSYKLASKELKNKENNYLAFNMRVISFMDSGTPIQRPNRPPNIHHEVSAASTLMRALVYICQILSMQ